MRSLAPDLAPQLRCHATDYVEATSRAVACRWTGSLPEDLGVWGGDEMRRRQDVAHTAALAIDPAPFLSLPAGLLAPVGWIPEKQERNIVKRLKVLTACPNLLISASAVGVTLAQDVP